MKLEQYIKQCLLSMKDKGIEKADFTVHLDNSGTVDSNAFNTIRFTVDLTLEQFQNKNTPK